MCLLIATAILFAGLNFLSHGLMIQAIMSFVVSFGLLSVFLYRLIKYRKCVFGKSKDCK